MRENAVLDEDRTVRKEIEVQLPPIDLPDRDELVVANHLQHGGFAAPAVETENLIALDNRRFGSWCGRSGGFVSPEKAPIISGEAGQAVVKVRDILAESAEVRRNDRCVVFTVVGGRRR